MTNSSSIKTLFLLTKTYPFEHGEQYVTDELEYLSKMFKKVIVYPNDYYSDNLKHTKTLPYNVEVLNLNQNICSQSENIDVRDYFYLTKITIAELFFTNDKLNFFKNFKWNLIQFWTQLQISKLFVRYINEHNLSSKNTVFYSYWFHKSAILLSILKDRNHIDKFATRAHSIDLYHNDWGIINENLKVPPFKMFKLKFADAVFTVSNHGALYLKQKFASYSNKIYTQYLGVFINENLSKKQTYDSFHIVTCSGIDENKRIHKLAEALSKMNAQITWTHFGTGELLSKVAENISHFPLSIKAQLMGSVPNNVVKRYYAENEIDLFVNLSIVEGLPVSIMEAMANEIPILATAIYGTPEAVIEGENGFLMDVNFTINDLVARLNYCIEHKEELKKMGKTSRDIYMEKFNAEKNYSQFANYLASL